MAFSCTVVSTSTVGSSAASPRSETDKAKICLTPFSAIRCLNFTSSVPWQGSLARIFHEYASIHLVAGMIAGVVAFKQKDSLYQARRLPNANVF